MNLVFHISEDGSEIFDISLRILTLSSDISTV